MLMTRTGVRLSPALHGPRNRSWGWGGDSRVTGTTGRRQPRKEVVCKSRGGCARPPAVPEGIPGGPLQDVRSLGGFSAPRPTGSTLGSQPGCTSNRLKVDARPRPRHRSGPSPCGRLGAEPRGCRGDLQCLRSGLSASAAMATRQPCRRKPSPCRTRQPPEPPLKLKVVGLFKSSSFQVSKTIAEVTSSPRHYEHRRLPASVSQLAGLHVPPPGWVGV